jgi:hypothetical protein
MNKQANNNNSTANIGLAVLQYPKWWKYLKYLCKEK